MVSLAGIEVEASFSAGPGVHPTDVHQGNPPVSQICKDLRGSLGVSFVRLPPFMISKGNQEETEKRLFMWVP